MISPAFLDELARFESGIDQQTTSIQQGEQQSQSVGEGLTFSDYRRYSRGDDTRLIDWRLYARTGEYYIK
ncbi:MAG: conserved repeat domain protein, partial [Haloquadratum sp. J07HQX50]